MVRFVIILKTCTAGILREVKETVPVIVLTILALRFGRQFIIVEGVAAAEVIGIIDCAISVVINGIAALPGIIFVVILVTGASGILRIVLHRVPIIVQSVLTFR